MNLFSYDRSAKNTCDFNYLISQPDESAPSRSEGKRVSDRSVSFPDRFSRYGDLKPNGLQNGRKEHLTFI